MAGSTSSWGTGKGSVCAPRFPPQQIVCQSASYRILDQQLGAGSFGLVVLGEKILTGELVAVKSCDLMVGDASARRRSKRLEQVALAELEMLKVISDPRYVVQLWDHCVHDDGFVMLILEKASSSLCDHLRVNVMAADLARCFAWKLGSALRYLHGIRILHRDLAPKNVLLFGGVCPDQGSGIKISDLGLACRVPIAGEVRHDFEAVTLPYRSPELLLGCRTYGFGIDCWSYGCLVAEMALREPLFQCSGGSAIGTIISIFKRLGTPSETTLPGCTSLLHFKLGFPKFTSSGLADVQLREVGTMFDYFGHRGLQLLHACLELDPAKRLSAAQIEQHDMFQATGVSIQRFPFNQFSFGSPSAGSSACGTILVAAALRFLRGTLGFQESAWLELYQGCLSQPCPGEGVYVEEMAKQVASEQPDVQVATTFVADAAELHELLCSCHAPAVLIPTQSSLLFGFIITWAGFLTVSQETLLRILVPPQTRSRRDSTAGLYEGSMGPRVVSVFDLWKFQRFETYCI